MEWRVLFCRCSGKVQEVENVVNEPLFSALCKIFTGCYFNGTIIHLFYKKNRGYLSHQDSSPGKVVRYQEVKQKGSSQSSRPLFLFCLFLFQFFLWAHCMEWENRERKQLQADCTWSESRNLESSWLLDKNSFILGRVATSRDRLLWSIQSLAASAHVINFQ